LYCGNYEGGEIAAHKKNINTTTVLSGVMSLQQGIKDRLESLNVFVLGFWRINLPATLFHEELDGIRE
jgi:hypothetical protein